MWQAVPLEGELVRLEPLEERHREGLRAAGTDPRTWPFMPVVATGEAFDGVFDAALAEAAAGLRLPYATVRRDEAEPVGSTSFLAPAPEHRRIEIGWTWLAPSAWGTGVNVEAKLLLLDDAFGRLGCRRVEFKTDARNARSRGALAALPARFEGVFAKHMLVRDGESRDSAWYAILDDDWPAVRANLLRRLGRA